LEGRWAIFELNRKVTQSNKGEGGPTRELEQSIYWKNAKATIGVVMVYWKNPVVVARCGGDEAKFEHGSRETRSLKDGDEEIMIEGWTCLSLPQPDGGVQ